MKTSIALALILTAFVGHSGQANAQVPPPLEPVQIIPAQSVQVRTVAEPQPAARPAQARAAVRPQAQPQRARAATARSTQNDAAGRAFNRCVAREDANAKRSAISCLNREIARAEAAIGTAEVRVLNCGQLEGNESATTQMMMIRSADENQFQSMLSSAGRIGPRKTREIELRATLNHLAQVERLANRVCGTSTREEPAVQQVPAVQVQTPAIDAQPLSEALRTSESFFQ